MALYELTKVTHCTAKCKDGVPSALICPSPDMLLCDAQSKLRVTDSAAVSD